MKKKLVAGILILSLAMPVIVQAKRTPALNKKKVSIKVGKRIQLKVKNKGKRKIKWSSTKKKIASVNKKGLVTAKKAGTAKIKAKVGRKTLTCKVTVKKRTVKNPSQSGNPKLRQNRRKTQIPSSVIQRKIRNTATTAGYRDGIKQSGGSRYGLSMD